MEVSAFAASLIEQAKRPPAPGSHNLGRPPKRDRADGKKSLAQLFAESPLRGLDLSFESDRASAATPLYDGLFARYKCAV